MATQMSSAERKERMMEQVRNELAVASAQELINKVNEKCFAHCLPSPGKSLSKGESECLTKCMNAYMQAWNVVGSLVATRVRENSQGP